MTTYGIVLLPDCKTVEFVKFISQSVRDNQIYGATPHISLLHIRTGREELNRLIDAFSKLNPSRQIIVDCNRINLLKSGWCFLEAERSKVLEEIQELVLPLASLRTQDTEFSWRAYASDQQKKAFEEYGYPNVGIDWQPHFTFGFTKHPNPITHSIAFRACLNDLALAEMGEYGTVKQVLKRCRL
jgi:hypothetical protein